MVFSLQFLLVLAVATQSRLCSRLLVYSPVAHFQRISREMRVLTEIASPCFQVLTTSINGKGVFDSEVPTTVERIRQKCDNEAQNLAFKQSRPESGLDWRHTPGKSLERCSGCSCLVRQRSCPVSVRFGLTSLVRPGSFPLQSGQICTTHPECQLENSGVPRS